MREFGLDIEFKNGLRPYDDPGFNLQGLVECINLRPTERGLVSVKTASNPFSAQPIIWPFPQLVKGKGVTFYLTATGIYTVDEDTWTATLLTTYDFFNKAVAKSAVSGGAWHLIDFADVWMLLNGSCTVHHTKFEEMFGTSANRYFCQNDVSIETGCDYRGRAFFGGFDSANFFTADWDIFWTTWSEETKPANLDLTGRNVMNTNFVMWTSIGGGDFLKIFDKDAFESGEVVDGYHGVTRPLIYDYLIRNEWGFMPMPWQGTVRLLKPLRKGVVVYGSGGVSALVPVFEPTTTMGLVELLNGVGIAGRSAVAGGLDAHVFVDQEGYLWSISGDMTLKKLGYREYFKDHTDDDLIGSYNPSENEFYFCNKEVGYVLTTSGLARTGQLFTSGQVMDGIFQGIVAESGLRRMELVSDVFDMEKIGMKTISQIDLLCEHDEPIQVAVDFRYGKSEEFRRSDWITLHDDGVCYPLITGTDFRLVIRANPIQNLRLSKGKVWWQASDKRFKRGV